MFIILRALMNSLDTTRTSRSQVRGADLDRIARYFQEADTIDRAEVEPGDRLVVVTLNSTYTLHYLGDGRWRVTGGWFEKNTTTPAVVRITGCSLGGSVINQRVVVGSGLRIEFDNRVVTTTIRRFTLWRTDESILN